MRAPSNLLAAVLLVPSFVGGACLSQNEIVEGTLTKSLFASPADGTSGLDSLQVGLGVSPPRPDDDVDRVVMGTTLATWPDLGPIEASRIPATPTGLPPEITATTPVPEGWYAAILPSLPPSLAPSSTSIYRLSDGRHVVRVRVGSAPVPWSFEVCPKGDGRTAVVTNFSEPVHAATTSAMPLTVAAGPPGAPVDCAPSPGPLVDSSNQTYEHLCAASLGPKDVVSITVTSGLLSGKAVEAAAFARVVAVETLVPNELESSCAALVVGP